MDSPGSKAMRRLTLLLLLLSTPAFAQQDIDYFKVAKIQTYFDVDATLPANGTKQYLKLGGVFPSVTSGSILGVYFTFTSAGSSANLQIAHYSQLLAGYTGSAGTFGFIGQNAVSGTGANPFQERGNAANFGVAGVSDSGTAGIDVGTYGEAHGGATNFGVFGESTYNGFVVTNVGVAGFARTGLGAVSTGGYFALQDLPLPFPTFIEAALVADNTSIAAPIAVFRDNGAALPSTGATTTSAVVDGGQIQSGNEVLTSSTMTAEIQGQVRSVYHSYTWTNAMITALGATGSGDVNVAILPAKTVVENVYVVILTPDSSANALTVACGRTGALFVDYIVASDAKAVSGTVYGDSGAERGTNLTGFDLPNYAGTTTVTCHFIKTTTNLNTVTGSSGRVIIKTSLVP